jgi:hypothetical protein
LDFVAPYWRGILPNPFLTAMRLHNRNGGSNYDREK